MDVGKKKKGAKEVRRDVFCIMDEPFENIMGLDLFPVPSHHDIIWYHLKKVKRMLLHFADD